MKRIAVLLLALLMLCGCGAKPESDREGWNRYVLIADVKENQIVSIDFPENYLVATKEDSSAAEEIVGYLMTEKLAEYLAEENKEEIRQSIEKVCKEYGGVFALVQNEKQEKKGTLFFAFALQDELLYEAWSVAEYYMNDELETTLEGCISKDPAAEFCEMITLGENQFFKYKIAEEIYGTAWCYIAVENEKVFSMAVFDYGENAEKETMSVLETVKMK